MTEPTKPQASRAKPEALDTKDELEKALFVQVLGCLAAKGTPVAEAVELAKDYAIAGVAVYF